jgi:hypothetical protein
MATLMGEGKLSAPGKVPGEKQNLYGPRFAALRIIESTTPPPTNREPTTIT